jgi:hypothetical protein
LRGIPEDVVEEIGEAIFSFFIIVYLSLLLDDMGCFLRGALERAVEGIGDGEKGGCGGKRGLR